MASMSEAGGSLRTFYAGDVLMQSGRMLAGVELVYEVHGEMNEDKSNVILHPTSFGASHSDLRYRIGEGGKFTLDTSQHCVIVCNLLGNGVSSSPSSSSSLRPAPTLEDWAWPSMYDNVKLMRRLIKEELKLSCPLAMIFGYSMGAMAALHFASLFPSDVERVAAVCGVACTSDYNKVFLSSLREGLCADGAWDEEKKMFTCKPVRGLRAFGSIYAGWGLSPSFYRNKEFASPSVGDFRSLEDFVERGYVEGFQGCEPHDLLAMLHTWYTGDIGNNDMFLGDRRKAFKAIQARVCYMPCETDRYFTVEDAAHEVELVDKAELRVMPFSWGHRAGDPHRRGQEEQDKWITKQVKEMLET
ncbi:hypothetical protein GUITHDRAFT_141354 [Guillardia theta CCMP2712]|uniref:AB hydrolase-1 domain-containing protein n=2 Tax=Guillardia theta TaxID=55529 RepID=L1J1P4_GUITC|nr:hypothetical protein GUITHDRAFT_141354 [Guillardia theta CCMP2712]EKX42426.1 hypothetical protein GUITHDRAFT_141354 [Guillardia theta CCMP2712]|eukprot:XP_005829406.1 hypothetical protein GUITHDRAFT_141354 [Guillardia theta CCMP2712]